MIDASLFTSFFRGRRLESYFEATSHQSLGLLAEVQAEQLAAGPPAPSPAEPDKGSASGPAAPGEAADDALLEDDERWTTVALSMVRIVACFVTMLATTMAWTVVMLLLLPWPYVRIRQGNLYGHVTGRLMMWILGNPVKIQGTEFSNMRAIYICNHASPIDIFLTMWLTPTGTVGIAKKEIIWYPLFGQIYVLANHLRIDRSNPTAAIESLKKAACAVEKNNLSLVIFPEGTRSKSGRLLPFKKGFMHIALQTRLPIVPIVLTGTHLAWRKGSLKLRPTPITVKFLPPIKTNDWEARRMNSYVEMIHSLYSNHLPPSQRPLAPEEKDFAKSSEL